MNKNNFHKCNIYGNFQDGRPTFIKDKGLLWDLPPQVDNYFEQQTLQQKLIKQFLSKNNEHT